MSPAEVQEARKQMDEWLDNAVREEVIDALVGARIVQDAMLNTRERLDAKLAEVRELAESKQRAKVGGGFLSGSLNTADVLAILDE